MTSLQTIGVIGTGTMGSGIAQTCAVVGLSVTMIDVDEAAAARGRHFVSSSLDRLVKKEKLPAADKEAALKRIDCTTDYGALVKCDFAVFPGQLSGPWCPRGSHAECGGLSC